jgi:hypothetical protein
MFVVCVKEFISARLVLDGAGYSRAKNTDHSNGPKTQGVPGRITFDTTRSKYETMNPTLLL